VGKHGRETLGLIVQTGEDPASNRVEGDETSTEFWTNLNPVAKGNLFGQLGGEPHLSNEASPGPKCRCLGWSEKKSRL